MLPPQDWSPHNSLPLALQAFLCIPVGALVCLVAGAQFIDDLRSKRFNG